MRRILAVTAILTGGLPVAAADVPAAAIESTPAAPATGPRISFIGYGWASALPPLRSSYVSNRTTRHSPTLFPPMPRSSPSGSSPLI